MFVLVQIHMKGGSLKEFFCCRCSHMAYRKDEKNNPAPDSINYEGYLNCSTVKMSGWPQTFTELTGKYRSCSKKFIQ